MTLLDRFRTQPGQHHPDPAVRLQYVADISLDARDVIAAVAREDQDPRVRRAAVAKLLDPSALGVIAESDADEGVREQAVAMLQDIAQDVFEGVSESESLEAVDALRDPKKLGQIAKAAVREIVALRALSRISEPKVLGSVARHAVSDAARQGAFAVLRERNERAEILGVAMNGEYKETVVAAVDMMTERADLESVAAHSRNKSGVKRARTLLREADELAAREAAATAQSEVISPVPEAADHPLQGQEPEVSSAPVPLSGPGPGPDVSEPAAERDSQEQKSDDTLAERLLELCAAAEGVGESSESGEARQRVADLSREWRHLTDGHDVEPAIQARFLEAVAKSSEHESIAAQEADASVRREALIRLEHLAGRAESLVQKPEITLKAGERAVRDLRRALESMPPLPSKQDFDAMTSRLKAAQDALVPKVLELRDAADWRRFANAAIQEQLCFKMAALADHEDPDHVARAVRDLQQQWRAAADVPRAQADALWRRFKDAHDVVWAKTEALFATQAEARAANFEKKIELCEKAEALADSTNWISTADQLKQLQAEWKNIGPVTRGSERSIWERFRSACDSFFKRRHEDLAARKKTWAENLTKKEALCERAEALSESSDWDQAASELKRLQGEWKTIGPVRKNRSEAIWQRFRTACDRFFQRYAARHDTARAERVAAREAICNELEMLVSPGTEDAPGDLVERLRTLRTRWQQEIAARGVDLDSARALDARFTDAFATLIGRWPASFTGTDLDPEASRRRLETLVNRVEELAQSLAGPAATDAADESELSPTDRLAARLKEALAANTIGGRGDDDSRLRLAGEAVRQARDAWSRVGSIPPVADAVRRELTDRFQRACQRIGQHVGSHAEPPPTASPSGSGRSSRSRRSAGPRSTGR